jgi:ectoine hydroxylase-related dioxygenase (phytanoyl-CoA dioxygenase family)
LIFGVALSYALFHGFHSEEYPAGRDPRRADLRKEAIPIAGKAGDLVIWQHALPHGSSPNQARLPRFVEYINMRPSYWERNPVWR